MSYLKTLLWLVWLPLLVGCLRIELTGSVAGAAVEILNLRTGQVVVGDLRSLDVAGAEEYYGSEDWASYSPAMQLELVGTVAVSTETLDDDTYYLVRATGGRDMDWDEDARIDAIGFQIDGSIHAVMTGAQLKMPDPRVNAITDGIYRLLRSKLSQLSNQQLADRLNQLAAEAIVDVNNDGVVDYSDVLSWSQTLVAKPYPGAADFLARSQVSIALGLGEDILELDAENLIGRADWRPAVTEGNFSHNLVGCLSPVLVRDLCRFLELPLMGQETASPTVADVMARLVVSHPWMADRFREVLNRMPEDVLMLFRSLAAIAIGDDIRPSNFQPGTATMHLDAGQLWVTDEERRTISTEADFRADFASQVAFADFWRYVEDNQPIFAPLDENGDSSIEDVAKGMAALLFHELAHAADAFPPGLHDDLLILETPFDVLEAGNDLSNDLTANLPLQSEELRGIAGVLFLGFSPTPAEASYTPQEVGAFFAPDGASDIYGYSTQYEDLAVMFEESMMAIHYGIQRDIAYTSLPAAETDVVMCSDFQVGWGVRGRIGAPQVKSRLSSFIGDLLPERNYASELAALPAPVAMNTSRDWCENLELDASSAKLQRRPAARPQRQRATRVRR